MNEFIEAALAGLSQSSKRKYKVVFSSFLSLVPLSEAKPIHVRIWASRRESAVSRRTLKQQLYMLSRFFKVVGRKDLSDEARSLAKEIRSSAPPPKVDEALIRTYSEIDGIISEAKPLVRAAIVMLAETGMRVGELVSLRWGDLDMSNRRALVKGKGDKSRYVYFTERTERLLRELGKEDERVFPVSDRTVRRWVSQLLKTHPHAVRHAFAVWFLSRGGSPRVLQHILGHSNLRTTEVYLDISQSLVEREYRLVVQGHNQRT
ncbi:MAG: tyrosine-type recombinase/integrase [Candidatus Korarchaeum sp.]|nr:tyrosine-type recombinase/integrase [Candidatus Korarchaeum sp.]